MRYIANNSLESGSPFQTIMQKLKDTEANYEVKIPLAIESGSRAWGFASATADYDCRFIYVNKKDWYLTILDKKDFIEYAVDEVFDIKGYNLSRALKYIMKSQAVIFEYLSSNVIYTRDENFTRKLQGLADEFFNPLPVSYHYLNLARNMLKDINLADNAKIKKYFYVLRPIANLNFIWQYRKMPYIDYDKTLAETNPEPEVVAAILELKEIKANSEEHSLVPRHEMLISYFQSEIEKFDNCLKDMKHSKNRNYAIVDEVFKSILEDVWK